MPSDKKIKTIKLKKLISQWSELQNQIDILNQEKKILKKKSDSLFKSAQKIIDELEITSRIEITDNNGELKDNVIVQTKKIKAPININLISKILCDSLENEEVVEEICQKIEQSRQTKEYKYLKKLKIKKNTE